MRTGPRNATAEGSLSSRRLPTERASWPPKPHDHSTADLLVRRTPNRHPILAQSRSYSDDSFMGMPADTLVSYASVSLEASPPQENTAPRLGGTAALMIRVAKRDESALGELYDATNRLVYGLVLRLVREPSTAEDITMEVYLQVWRTAHSYNTARGTV